MKKFFITLKKIWCTPPLFVKILIGLALGILLGFTAKGQDWISFIGDCFIFMLKAIAPVLVFFVISSSIGKSKKGGFSRFALVIALYLVTTFVASLIAVGANFIFKVKTDLPSSHSSGEIIQLSVGDIIKNLFISAFTNPIQSISDGNYIGILFWSILLGVAIKVINKQRVADVFGDISDAISIIIKWLMELTPIAIIGLIYKPISEQGANVFADYGLIMLLIVSLFLVVLLAVNPFFYFVTTRKNPYPVLFNCIKDSGIHAFFIRSSAANIPNNLKVCDRYEVSRDFSSVSISLGSVINMNGAAIALTSYTLIACFSTNTPVEFGSAILLSIVATIAACGTSGIANGALLLLPLSCSLFGLGETTSDALIALGMSLSIVVDSFETMLNSASDAYFTIAADIAFKKIQIKNASKNPVNEIDNNNQEENKNEIVEVKEENNTNNEDKK